MSSTKSVTNAIDFLAFSYFGSTFNDEDIFNNALRVAFKDASLRGALVLKCRNKKEFNFSDDDKSLFRFIMREELIEKTKEYFKNHPITSIESKDDFDEFHKKLCEELVNWFDNKYNELVCNYCEFNCFKNTDTPNISYFTYGNAQKFVNMMFKNLYIISVLSEKFEFKGLKHSDKYIKMSEWYHIPIDSYILEIVEDKETTWSKIDKYSNYRAVQDSVKNELNTIDDEFPKWIEISKNHKEIDFNKTKEKAEKLLKDEQ